MHIMKLKNLLATVFKRETNISENMKYHIDNVIPVSQNVFRNGSRQFFELIKEARKLHSLSLYNNPADSFILETDLGDFALYENRMVPLDLPMINEAEYEGKQVDLNKPKRGGSKKFYVYVKDPDSGNVRKISFGAADGGGKLSVKIKDRERRKAFADRHRCKDKKDKTTPGYWSCNLPRYAKTLGLGDNMNTYW